MPSAWLLVALHLPVAGSQVPATWQAPAAGHVTPAQRSTAAGVWMACVHKCQVFGGICGEGIKKKRVYVCACVQGGKEECCRCVCVCVWRGGG